MIDNKKVEIIQTYTCMRDTILRTKIKYKGVENIRTLEIFGQCWKYSDNFLSLKILLEIFGQNLVAL